MQALYVTVFHAKRVEFEKGVKFNITILSHTKILVIGLLGHLVALMNPTSHNPGQ